MPDYSQTTLARVIFCPNGHLVLDANHCNECDWERPMGREVGQTVWGPVEIGSAVGVAGTQNFIGWGMIDQALVFPRNNGGWIALSRDNGEVLWQVSLFPGQVIRQMVVHKGCLLASVNDERDLLRAEHAKLICIDVKNQSYTTLWEAETASLTPPAIYQGRIVLRDAIKGLVILSGEPPYSEIFNFELENFSPSAPKVVNNTVVVCDGSMMHSTVQLKGFDPVKGSQVWESDSIANTIASLLVVEDRYLVFSKDRRNLAMLDSDHTEDFKWEVNLSKIYADPVIMGENLGVVTRGTRDPEADDHYLFTVLKASSGEVVASMPLGTRFNQILALSEHTVIVTGHDGDYRAVMSMLDPFHKKTLWTHCFDREADPIQVSLKADDHLFYTATAAGQVYAIQHTQALEEAVDDPAVLISQDKYSEAAAVYALFGDYLQSAQIFDEQLGQTEKALLLLEHGKLLNAAGALAKERGWHQRALEYFEAADNQQAQAEVWEAMGDKIEAAKRFEELGMNQKAGALFESVGDVMNAFRNYSKGKDKAAIKRLAEQINALPEAVEVNLRDIDLFLENDLKEQAANLALKIGQFDRAAKIYQEMGAIDNEFQTLVRMTRLSDTGKWVYERLAKLGTELRKYQVVGLAYERLEKYKQAAEAYETEADRILETEKNEQASAQLLMKVRDCFKECGQVDELPRIERRIIYYLRLPNIKVRIVRLDKPLREEETNFLTLEIINDGFGIAHDVTITVKSKFFDFQTEKIPLHIPRLAPDLSVNRQVYLKPHDHGQVPLDFEWHWNDRNNNPYEMQMTGQINVRSLDDSRTGQPSVVYATNWIASGDMINASGDNIMAGGQKGDQAIIGGGKLTMKGQGLGTITLGDEEENSPICLFCKRTIDQDDKFCNYCGHSLHRAEK